PPVWRRPTRLTSAGSRASRRVTRSTSPTSCTRCSRCRPHAAASSARRPAGARSSGGRGRASRNACSSRWRRLPPSMGEAQKVPYAQLLEEARAAFEGGTDLTVAVEEEFALLDPETLSLVNRFEEVKAAAAGSPVDDHLVGELIASEVEVRTGRCATYAEGSELMATRRVQLAELTAGLGLALGATG